MLDLENWKGFPGFSPWWLSGTTGGGTGGRDLESRENDDNDDDEEGLTATLADMASLHVLTHVTLKNISENKYCSCICDGGVNI